MDVLFYSKKILTVLVLPPTGPLLIAILGLLAITRSQRAGRILIWIGVSTLLIASLPLTSTSLLHAAIEDVKFNMDDARRAQAVVILGGGRRYAPEYGGETVSELTLERMRYGAMIARELNLPILVTGGSVYGTGLPEGRLMAQALEESFVVPAKWIETQSRDTHENAVLASRLLASEGIHTIVLVTQDFHMRRSVAEFRATGMQVVPAPVTYVPASREQGFPEQLPNAGALRNSALALHELLGYWLLAPKYGP